MSHSHLLLVTIGPIQEFIAQARRTRDLWFGSHALSELSRAAARAIADREGSLIFPALQAGDNELSPCDTPVRPHGRSPVSIANKILAAVNEPGVVAEETRDAVRKRWRTMKVNS